MRSSCTLQTDVFCNMTGELSFLTKVHWCSGISTLECLSPSQNCSKSILVVLQHGRSWQLSVMARNTMASPSGLWAILTKIWPNSLGTIYVRAPTTFFFFFPVIITLSMIFIGSLKKMISSSLWKGVFYCQIRCRL